MGRFCSGVLAAFRVVQFIFSLILLGIGFFISYEMFSLAASAHQLDASIESLKDLDTRQQIESSMGDMFSALDISDDEVLGFVNVLDHTLIPVLRFFEGTPIRAIIIAIAGLWSVSLIVYLQVARRRAATHPKMNKRSLRISLELLTLVLWLAAMVCAILLAMEYGTIVVAGGVEMKAAFTTIKAILKAALEKLFEDKFLTSSLDIVGDIVTIGAMSILAVASASICTSISFVSLIVACISSGKAKQPQLKDSKYTAVPAGFVPLHLESGNRSAVGLLPTQEDMREKKTASYSVSERTPQSSVWFTPDMPATPASPHQIYRSPSPERITFTHAK